MGTVSKDLRENQEATEEMTVILNYINSTKESLHKSSFKGVINKGLLELNLALKGFSLVPLETLSKNDYWISVWIDGEGYYIADSI